MNPLGRPEAGRRGTDRESNDAHRYVPGGKPYSMVSSSTIAGLRATILWPPFKGQSGAKPGKMQHQKRRGESRPKEKKNRNPIPISINSTGDVETSRERKKQRKKERKKERKCGYGPKDPKKKEEAMGQVPGLCAKGGIYLGRTCPEPPPMKTRSVSTSRPTLKTTLNAEQSTQ